MRYLSFILFIFLLHSCTKTEVVNHDIHDTSYLFKEAPLRIDTLYVNYSTFYPVPAKDSQTIYFILDTVAGSEFVLNDITIENAATFNNGVYAQVNVYHPTFPYFKVVSPMIANIKFHYNWRTGLHFQLQTFHYGSGFYTTWTTDSPSGMQDALYVNQESVFRFVDLPEVFTILITNNPI